MRCTTIRSGSFANCYIIGDNDENLIIEAGASINEIMEGIGFDLETVSGCLLTHEHGDHSKSVSKLMEKSIDVYSTKGTFEAMNIKHHRAKTIETKKVYRIGNFRVKAYDVTHDAKEPVCFEIYHKKTGKIVFITDTFYCRYLFQNVNHFLIEANYDERILLNKIYDNDMFFLKKRVMNNHFSIDETVNYLNKSDISKVNTILLLHLSDSNSDAEMFKTIVQEATGKLTYIAETWTAFELQN